MRVKRNWKFVFDFQPRAAVGFSFGLLLAAFAKLGFIENPEHEHPSFNEWMHEDNHNFMIGDFNYQGYLIEGIDWHEPISNYRDLKKIVKILSRCF